MEFLKINTSRQLDGSLQQTSEPAKELSFTNRFQTVSLTVNKDGSVEPKCMRKITAAFRKLQSLAVLPKNFSLSNLGITTPDNSTNFLGVVFPDGANQFLRFRGVDDLKQPPQQISIITVWWA
jgi:hypothetical protein